MKDKIDEMGLSQSIVALKQYIIKHEISDGRHKASLCIYANRKECGPVKRMVYVTVEKDIGNYDLYKALMEGTSYEMLLNFNTMKALTGKIEEIRATGGGATSDVWLQFKDDILATEITALSCKEVGAAGTTALACFAIGVFHDLSSAVSNMVTVRKVFAPGKERSEIYSKYYKKYANLYNAVKGL